MVSETKTENHWKLLGKMNAMSMAIVSLTQIRDPYYDEVITKLTNDKKLLEEEYKERGL